MNIKCNNARRFLACSKDLFTRWSFLLLLLGTFPAFLAAQTLDISVTTPTSTSVCGPLSSFELTVENTSSMPANNVVIATDLGPEVTLLNASGPGSVNGNDISIGNLNPGASRTITVTFQVGCSFSGDDLEFSLNAISGGTGNTDSDAIQVTAADLSIPGSSPAVLQVYNGLTTTVTTTVVNNDFGSITSFTYCVSNNLNYLQLESILIGTTDITANGVAFTNGTQNCYTVDQATISSVDSDGVFGQMETISPVETWTVVSCPNSAADIRRRVQYGCLGDQDCQEKPNSNFTATGVSFDQLSPDIDAEVISATMPACYVDNPTENVIRFTNNGTAPAQDIRFRILTDGNGRDGMAIDLNSITVVRESDNSDFNGLVLSNAVMANDCRSPGIRDVRGLLDDVNLAAGESLIVTYNLVTNCDCNDCDIRNKYWSEFRLESYTDNCNSTINDRESLEPSGRFDAIIRGFPEGPASLFDGQSGCITYFATTMQLDWLTDDYPNSELIANFTIPCGVDYVPNSFTWTDRDGMTFAANVSYTDNNNQSDDILNVTFDPNGRPNGFNYSGGAQFEFCVTVDCDEKPDPPCGDAFFDVEFDAQFDFVTDPTCPSTCRVQKIWDAQNFDLRLACPNTDPTCVCDGITFTNLDISRTNFGIADDNNNQVPSGTIDPADLELDRYIAGDTMKVNLEGLVNDADDNRDFDHGYVTFPFTHPNFTPLSATVEVFDADNGNAQYVCSAVPVMPDYANERIILDFSRDALNNLGCGLPGGFLYEDGDSIAICLTYTEKDSIANNFRLYTYEPSFYLSEDPFEDGIEYQCNPLLEQMTQIGYMSAFQHTNNDFGACQTPNWEIRYDRNLGGGSTDEFPNEIRPIGIPDRLVFTKPSEFEFRLDEWDVVVRQRIPPANNIVDTRTSNTPPIPSQYFVVNGDEVTFLVGDYLESLSDLEIPPDEGYRISIFPRIQGNCQSVPGDYTYSYQFFERVEENIFCTDEIANPVEGYSFEYTGGAELSVISDLEEIRLCGADEVAGIRVRNTGSAPATNSFLYLVPNSSITINRVERANNNNEITPNNFGIYELGNINGNRNLALNVFFTKNNCADEELNLVAGWDCSGYPTTINDATCSDPSSIRFTNANSNASMVIRQPVAASNEIVELCEPVTYELDILSSDLGYVRDIGLFFSLPPGQTYVPGSMEFAYPSVASGGSLMTVNDPVALNGNQFFLDVSTLNSTLNNEGLVGSKDPANSVLTLRFAALTECGYISGSRARFLLESSNSCGDPLRVIRRRSGRVRIRPESPSISVEIEPRSLALNACNMDTTTTGVVVRIESGDLTGLDSIRMVLPEGIVYLSGTYVPGTNANPGNDPATIRVINGITTLIWPLISGIEAGDEVTFDIDIAAADVGQLCADSEISVEAYTSFMAECNGDNCAVGELAGDGVQSVAIQKPTLDFEFIEGTITLNPADGTAAADLTAKAINLGFGLDAGRSVTIDIYEDSDNNGLYDPTIDVFLFSMDTTLVSPLNPGECLFISTQASVPASEICSIVGVIDPDRTCSCSELSSTPYRPEIVYDFQTEYEVCSGESITVGPQPVQNYTFDWLSVDGSDLGNLSQIDATPVTFSAPVNNSGQPITLQYKLRSANAPCFDDQLVSITIQPSTNETQNVNACLNTPFNLPSISDPNATNFSWSPAAGLTISDGGRLARVDNVTGSATYTLTYTLGDGGCPASLVVNLMAVNCGGAITELGDTVWFDFNENGQFDPGEPAIGGVTVNLIDANTGAVISTTVTNANGYYLFDNLPAGQYAVAFIPLPGFVFTSNDATGVDDADDSDADPQTGVTPSRFLALNEQDYTFDAGFVPDCSLSLDLSVGECQPSGDTLARRLIISVEWDGNPYAYDQFGDGRDTIDVTLNGVITSVVVDDLMGTQIVIDSLLDPAQATSFSASAVFREADGCSDAVTTGPFEPCLYDLALIKQASTIQPTPGPYTYGDTICMDIIVVNQGSQSVNNVQVFDQLPAGLGFVAERSPEWTEIGTEQLYIFRNPIPPGQRDTATICVELLATAGGADAYTNVAEINSFQDTLGNDFSPYDEDSTPDQDFTNDPGGAADSPADGTLGGDGSGVIGGEDPLTDEDDADPFRVSVFDLALTKTITTSSPYAVGDVVTYSFFVTNQGNEAAENIRLIDYIPTGFTFESSNSPTWGPVGQLNPSFDTTTTVIAGPLAPGEDVIVTLDLRVSAASGSFDLTNVAELISFTGPNGTAVTDIDSAPDIDPTNDAGGSVDSDSDNVLTGDGSGIPGDSDPLGDEDDADPALLSLDSVSIGSTVFVDFANNGIQDGSDFGIPGVTVELLLDANGDMMITGAELTPVLTTQTDANGNYYFGMLLPGNYQVRIPATNFDPGGGLADYGTSSTPTSTTDDDIDNNDDGSQAGGIFSVTTSPIIRLIPGTEPLNGAENGPGGNQDVTNGQADGNGNMTIDFGFLSAVSIGSTVFADYNDNAIQDGGEPGLSGVAVFLFFDADGNGSIDGGELTPIASMDTDGQGNYFFGNLLPGMYQVSIQPSEFAGGETLEFLNVSSTDITTTNGDNQTDGDDNGIQAGGPGTLVLSPLIDLQPGTELTDANGETGSGTNADDAADANGDMTIDFGFVCVIEITGSSPTASVCSTKDLDLDGYTTIEPSNVDGTWSTDGDGTFLVADGSVASLPRHSIVTAYRPGAQDILAGRVTLTLTTDAAGPCPPVTYTIELTVINVDCGGFPWDGN